MKTSINTFGAECANKFFATKHILMKFDTFLTMLSLESSIVLHKCSLRSVFNE